MTEFDSTLALFQREINKHDFVFDSILDDGRVLIKRHDTEFRVSLDNARKSYEATGSTATLHELVAVLLSYTEQLPEWDIIRPTLVPIIVPTDMDVGDAICKPLTDSTLVVVVRNQPDQLIWVQHDHLAEWAQSEEALFTAAHQNLDQVLINSEVKPAELEGHSYGIVLGQESHLDCSVPLAPGFKDKVQEQFGWPVYVVMPVRDLCFVFSEKELDFFSQRLGRTIIEEFATSPYPVSRELLRVTDAGVEAVGHFESTEK